jgi:hypothetical protein
MDKLPLSGSIVSLIASHCSFDTATNTVFPTVTTMALPITV